MQPSLVMCNIFSDPAELRDFAGKNQFSGIDWSFDMNGLPERPAEETAWAKDIATLAPFEIRYHCPFYHVDLGHNDPEKARQASRLFTRIIRLVSKAGGRYLTIHIGLGRDSTRPLSWETTIDNLRRVVRFGAEHGVRVCLENLAWGWSSKPNLFEKLIRRSGAGVTLDIGHAFVCESVQSRQYDIEDFVAPHRDRVFNAHIYHTELSGKGHLPPEKPEQIIDRLRLLEDIGCNWWVIEIKEPTALLSTKRIIEYSLESNLDSRAQTAKAL